MTPHEACHQLIDQIPPELAAEVAQILYSRVMAARQAVSEFSSLSLQCASVMPPPIDWPPRAEVPREPAAPDWEPNQDGIYEANGRSI